MVKKISALVMSAAMLSSCSATGVGGILRMDGSYIATANGENIDTGVYMQIAAQAYSEQMSTKLEPIFEDADEEPIMKRSREILEMYVKAAHVFDERGFSLSPVRLKAINNRADEMYNTLASSLLYKQLEVSKEDVVEYIKYYEKAKILFEDMYVNNITDDQKLAELNKYYYPITMIPYSFVTDEGELMNDTDRKAVIDRANGHLNEIKNGKKLTDKLYEIELEEYRELAKKNPELYTGEPKEIYYPLRIAPVRKAEDKYTPPEILKYLKTAEVGQPGFIETEGAGYIIEKVNFDDMAKVNRDSAYSSLLEVEKKQEFTEQMIATEMDYKLNDVVVDIVSPRYVESAYKKAQKEFEKILLAQLDAQKKQEKLQQSEGGAEASSSSNSSSQSGESSKAE